MPRVQEATPVAEPTLAEEPVVEAALDSEEGDGEQVTTEPAAETVAEAEAEPTEAEPTIDWNEYLRYEPEDEQAAAAPVAAEAKEEDLTWDQTVAKIKQDATYGAIGIIQGYMENQGKLGSFLQAEPEQVRQFAQAQFNRLPPELKAQPGVAENLADIAIGRRIRMERQKAVRPTVKSATPRSEQPSNVDASTEREIESWVARLVAAGQSKQDARKEVLSWLK